VETVIDCVVSPVLHVFPVIELEVKVAVCPAHKFVSEAVIVGVVGNGFIVTVVVVDVAEHPLAPTVTE
jgi:hypothetical protein